MVLFTGRIMCRVRGVGRGVNHLQSLVQHPPRDVVEGRVMRRNEGHG